MEEQFPLLYHIALNIGLPTLTLFMGWFGNAWRSRQRKEADVLDNVQQILEMQKAYIAEQQGTIVETKAMNKRLEAKLDRKNRSIRQANRCKFTNEGDGCPVLVNEEKNEEDKCETCKYNQENANCQD